MFVGEGLDWADGVNLAWHELSLRDTPEVCRCAEADYDRDSASYIVRMLGADVRVCTGEKIIRTDSAVGELLINELPHYSRLSLLCYLARARDIPPSGRLVNPREVGGGLIFSLGSHRLPLDKIAERYGNDTQAFIQRGKELGGQQGSYGDVSVQLFPFPRIPLMLLLWAKDEEFPARVEALFDFTCSEQLPPDIIWSTAMMVVLAMLK